MHIWLLPVFQLQRFHSAMYPYIDAIFVVLILTLVVRYIQPPRPNPTFMHKTLDRKSVILTRDPHYLNKDSFSSDLLA